MTVQIIPKSNITPNFGLKQVSSINFKGDSIVDEQKQPEKRSNKLKVGVFLTTLAGVVVAHAAILKTKGYSLNPSKIIKTPIKEWGVFGAVYEGEEFAKLKVKSVKDFIKKYPVESLVGTTAIGSVAGGLIGGKMFDKKENMKAKYRESIIQLVGNVATPLLCVSLGLRGFKKIKPQIVKYIPDVKNAKLDKIFKGIPGVLATTISLVCGIFLGNKVGNSINKHVFKCDDNRKIKVADMSPHIDDLCLSLSLVAANSPIGGYVTRVIPAALMIAGFSTGIAQEKPENICCETNKHDKIQLTG